MQDSPLIAPVVALVAWSLVMLLWMAFTRLPAMRKAGLKPGRGGRGANLEGVLPDQVNWKAHNYAHLMEQPTIFYAIIFALILLGADQPISVWLAWGYVVFRILHSLIQATVNIVFPYRFGLFLLSSVCLVALTALAAARLL